MIEGLGRLYADGGVDLGRVEYSISVDDKGALLEATGIFRAEPDVIGHAFNSDRLQLVREDTGRAMRIVVTNVTVIGQAEFRVSGSPGPMRAGARETL
ncbi:hypothetical protein ACSBOB_01630 [Mesorhizobium sp. ASY16-5R]|uniref:hypothetical protein n=1 Tax=Mesorhizobium sp. ASY16-5R TaxID=3445772 RepID=UPI003F9FC5D2